jgi:hypothetical protein
MKFIRSKKGVALLAVLAVAVMATVGAYAYWTTTGEGTGSAANASSNGTVTLHASWAADALYPGGAQDVSFTADNAGDTNLYVGTIHLDSVSVDDDHATCDVSDFSMADVDSSSEVLAGADHQAIAGTGSLVFANSDVSQDACKGATITLHLSSDKA